MVQRKNTITLDKRSVSETLPEAIKVKIDSLDVTKMNNGDGHMLCFLTYFTVSNARKTVTGRALQVLRKAHAVQIRAPRVAIRTRAPRATAKACAPRVPGSTVHNSRDTEQPRRLGKEGTVHVTMKFYSSIKKMKPYHSQ